MATFLQTKLNASPVKPNLFADTLVIGGGAVGLISAYYLAQAGADVLLVDDDNPSASWAGAGILSPLPPWRYGATINRLAAAGAAAYPKLLTDIGDDCDYRQQGMLVLNPDGEFMKCSARQKKTQPPRILNAGMVKNMIPFLSPTTADSVFLPTVAQLRPPRLIKALRRALGKRRVVGKAALNSPPQGDKNTFTVVVDDRYDIIVNKLVLAAGAWSKHLCRLPPSPQIEPVRGQMLLFAPPPSPALPCVILRNCDDFYLVQRPDGVLLVGSTATNDGFNNEVRERETAKLWKSAASLLPSLADTPPLRAWCGLRPKSADGLPIISQHPTVKNLFLNTAHFRYGLTMAPAAQEEKAWG